MYTCTYRDCWWRLKSSFFPLVYVCTEQEPILTSYRHVNNVRQCKLHQMIIYIKLMMTLFCMYRKKETNRQSTHKHRHKRWQNNTKFIVITKWLITSSTTVNFSEQSLWLPVDSLGSCRLTTHLALLFLTPVIIIIAFSLLPVAVINNKTTQGQDRRTV